MTVTLWTLSVVLVRPLSLLVIMWLRSLGLLVVGLLVIVLVLHLSFLLVLGVRLTLGVHRVLIII
ncbi:MAG: hypothetical protein JO296_07815 [Pseudonocardiales bacterium]|nr:hypothetical protein [Pseudonocardiales bacterium]MBV9650028.1 hypothetical protein [Pseudonocardiales bacterium]